MRRAWTVVAISGVLLGLAACAAPPAWQDVPLGSITPVSLVAGSNGVLVGAVDGHRPALIALSHGTVTSFTLHPNEPYAETAKLVAVGASGDRVWAIGTDIGGAHANPRWTVWDGSATAGSLTSRPQEFFTFGGHDAGPLLGVVEVAGKAVILGSRTTSVGARAVLHTATGTRWQPASTSPQSLTSGDGRLLGFTALSSTGSELVIVGDQVTLDAGLEQVPALWVGWAERWRQVTLPVPAELTGAGLVHATSVACDPTTCWVAGWVRGRPVAWRVPLDASARVEATVLSGELPPSGTPAALITLDEGRPVVATNAAAGTVHQLCPTGWRSLPAPPGATVTALVGHAGALYAVSEGRLWMLATRPC